MEDKNRSYYRLVIAGIAIVLMFLIWGIVYYIFYKQLNQRICPTEIFTFIGIFMSAVAGGFWLYRVWELKKEIKELSGGCVALQIITIVILALWFAVFVFSVILPQAQASDSADYQKFYKWSQYVRLNITSAIVVIVIVTLYFFQDIIAICSISSLSLFKVSVKQSLWSVELPSLLALILFSVVFLELFPATVGQDLTTGFCRGGLAFQVIIWTLGSVLGFPEFYWQPKPKETPELNKSSTPSE